MEDHKRRTPASPLGPATNSGLWRAPKTHAEPTNRSSGGRDYIWFLVLILLFCNIERTELIFITCVGYDSLGICPCKWSCLNVDNNLTTIITFRIISSNFKWKTLFIHRIILLCINFQIISQSLEKSLLSLLFDLSFSSQVTGMYDSQKQKKVRKDCWTAFLSYSLCDARQFYLPAQYCPPLIFLKFWNIWRGSRIWLLRDETLVLGVTREKKK